MFATFDGTWDWTAVGTLALAAATAVSLAFGWKSLRQAQREVEEAHRPVVVPVADLRDIDVGDDQRQRAQPLVPKAGWYLVPIENIGSGPALDIMLRIRRDGAGPKADIYEDTAWVAGLARDRVLAMPVRVSDGLEVPAEVWRFKVTIVYSDVAGKRWETAAMWEPIPGRYAGIQIERI